MAEATSQVQNPVSADAFTADRQRMFASFCNAATYGSVIAAVILVLMAVFLL